jgi:hypothetical protein
MFVPFQSLPPAARVWVFQANRPLSPGEIPMAEARLREFTDEWNVHGNPFNTSFIIKFNQFIILAADETGQSASGCSIDSSVRVLKEIEGSLGIDLFNRNLIAFRLGGKIALVSMNDLKQNFKDGILNEETLTFNNLVHTKRDLEESWLVPAGKTWLKRYIPNTLAKVK